MLDQIKYHYHFKRDADLARHLGIKPQALSNWRKRNSFDAELIYMKCNELNSAWLLTGEGPMLKEDLKGLYPVQEESSTYILTERINAMEGQIEALKQANEALQETNSTLRETREIYKKRIEELELQKKLPGSE
ncbi:helix-turn-helix domain-containing protein [Sinomicrobium weinanense]|uniref:Helix-turn-helix domain-containing protein n=1 Tax=Sinomicrobium weinanense TaxID=2842200 RepID=A0A926JRG5_9FLAO|nr:helix-turn-helix domain-containing protein [Sinomicrobium weinanense]MBC9795891.1 helix-turn-helix domain-containing protein [Sinomicrobium weinanense]MBU3124730.1 helix-turn-helix domain containing protein [Sinomicrobium weinanense]